MNSNKLSTFCKKEVEELLECRKRIPGLDVLLNDKQGSQGDNSFIKQELFKKYRMECESVAQRLAKCAIAHYCQKEATLVEKTCSSNPQSSQCKAAMPQLNECLRKSNLPTFGSK